MIVAVMGSAQGDRELIAHLEAHRARLSEPQMVGINRTSPVDQTRLRCHELEVGFIAKPTGFAERKLAFIDFAAKGIGCRRIIGDR